MIELNLRHEATCKTCGEDIAVGEPCFIKGHHPPFFIKSFTEQINDGDIYCKKCVFSPLVKIQKVVKIDPEGRFIFFVPPDTKKEVIDDMSTTIREWWESGDRFLWALGDITLVRLSDNGEAEVIFQSEEAEA